MFKFAAVMCILVALSGAAQAEQRCGWFENPTPANAWLTDKDGQWLIGAQGGFQADGDWPDFSNHEWIETNGHYGYGCACLQVQTKTAAKQITKITAATPKPIASCRNDKALTEPGAN